MQMVTSPKICHYILNVKVKLHVNLYKIFVAMLITAKINQILLNNMILI